MTLLAHSKETLALAETVRETHARNALLGQTDEFAVGASTWPRDLSRRHFLQLMGASLALAGVGGCNRPPSKEIVPYTLPPEAGLGAGAEALYYASVFSWQGFARGILVAAHTGRPTKIEGNPQHPESLGATDALTQAAILSLYDPDRSKVPLHFGQPTSWQAFDGAWNERRERFAANRGAGLVFLSEPTTSPTFRREILRSLDRYPAARWYQHTALPRYDREGQQADYDFARADVIFTIEADVFYTHPAAIRFSRAFASRRKLSSGQIRPNRLYTLEASPTLTGSMADIRLPASPQRWPEILHSLALKLGIVAAAEQFASASTDRPLTQTENNFVETLVQDLRAKAPNILCVVGEALPEKFHAFATALNAHFGSPGTTVQNRSAVRSDGDARCAGDLAALVASIDRQEVNALVLLDVNPVYTAGFGLGFEERLRRVPLTIHLGEQVDETAAASHWHLPQSHFLEAWSDLRSIDGTASIAQPLIAPLYESASTIELLRRLSEPPGPSSYELVRETWQASLPGADFEDRWRRWLDRGVIEGTSAPPIPFPSQPLSQSGATDAENAISTQAETVSIIFKPDPNVVDGRWSNHAWLQELPKPFTHLVWDNAVLVSPSFASKQDLRNGDMIHLATAAGALEAPVWITPAHAENCLTVHLGYGRRRVGVVGENHGFDAYQLRDRPRTWISTLREFHKTGRMAALVSTHDHFNMEGRDLARTIEFAALSQLKPESGDLPSLYPKVNYTGYAWGMSIDLSTCNGCNACVIACQAENNIPVVGKDQVARGREMHWIRIDRYYEGDPDNPRMLQQPVPCMHCENAPCELVCPVAATVHSSEGLNDMVYNRCVGTRYCSNNCPYKVRRFNFLDYRETVDSPAYLQKNPNVTIRERGVMEKCSYCVQRINAGRIRAERENRRVRDGEIATACQQACPVEAIVFGDINDAKSRVSQRKQERLNYALLGELNTRPRTTYLTRVLNTGETTAVNGPSSMETSS